MDHQYEVSKLLDNSEADIETMRNQIALPTTNSISATNSISTTTRITDENVYKQLRYHHDYF